LQRLGRVERVQRGVVVAPPCVAIGEQQRQLERVLELGLGQGRARDCNPVDDRLAPLRSNTSATVTG
jgi:hypothetical protein